jgi:TonB family protein
MSFKSISVAALLLQLSILPQALFEKGMITFNYTNQSLHTILTDIATKTGMNFIYCNDLINKQHVTCKVANSPVEEAINKILSSSNLGYKKFSENNYVLFRKIKRTKKPYGSIIEQKVDIRNGDSQNAITRPELISTSNPFYPAEALRNNIEGKVGIKLLINEEGQVIRTLVDKPSGSVVLDDAAIEYCTNLKFKPASVNQKLIKIWLSMVLNYKFD